MDVGLVQPLLTFVGGVVTALLAHYQWQRGRVYAARQEQFANELAREEADWDRARETIEDQRVSLDRVRADRDQAYELLGRLRGEVTARRTREIAHRVWDERVRFRLLELGVDVDDPPPLV